MIYTRECQFLMPTEGARALLSVFAQLLCDATPAPKYIWAGIFSNTPTIDCALEIADLTTPLFAGSGPQLLNPASVCTDSLEGPAQGVDGVWRLIMDQHIWTTNGVVDSSVYGAYLMVNDDNTDPAVGNPLLLAVDFFPDGPVPMVDNLDAIKLTGLFAVECNIPALPDA